MSGKVKVSREVANALDELKRIGDPYNRIEKYLDKYYGRCEWLFPYAPLKELEVGKFIKCLYVGYEIEQTPEEELLIEYKKLQQEVESSWHPATKERLNFGLSCIRTTLDIQGVKIEGINK